MPSVKMHRVLITGAGGRIGRGLRETLRGVYPILRLSDRVPVAPAGDGEEVDQTDIADMESVEHMVQGCDGIIHRSRRGHPSHRRAGHPGEETACRPRLPGSGAG